MELRYNKNGDVICSSMNCSKHKKLIFNDDKVPYCKLHFNTPESIESNPDKVYHRFTLKGERMCDAVGCKSLITVLHRGSVFCKLHRVDLNDIRSNIKHLDTPEELIYRIREIEFRKSIDPGHLKYVDKLYNKLQK